MTPLDDEIEVIASAKRHFPVDVVGTIRRLGIEYVEQPMPLEQSGFLAKRNGGYVIGVNSQDGDQRRRFTAAHELGHFVMHRDLLKEGQHFDRLFGRAADENPSWPFHPRHERQANDFAADFLMPATFAALRHRTGRSPADIAQEFGVSRRAAEIRLKRLGLLA